MLGQEWPCDRSFQNNVPLEHQFSYGSFILLKADEWWSNNGGERSELAWYGVEICKADEYETLQSIFHILYLIV